MINLRQKELDIWQDKNFGRNPDDAERVFLGMCEETGELAHAILKHKQGIREYASEFAYYDVALADAFGDLMICGVQLMTDLGIDTNEIIEDFSSVRWNKDYFGAIEVELGKISAYIHTFDVEKPVVKYSIAKSFSLIYLYGYELLKEEGVNAEEAFNNTVEEILLRDWKRFPKDGRSE